LAKLNKDELISSIEEMSVLELNDLVKALEEKFGVTAAAPVAAAPAAGSATTEAGAAPAEEQSTFNVILSSSGTNKISVIKAVREINPNLGLKEAKDLVDTAPKPVAEGVGKEAAEEAKKKLTEAGATVELQ
jgi:large subunit ribosomal protein L7/L12